MRLEPGVKAAFAKLWGTDKLVSSMDGGAIMLPGQTPPAELDANWAHIDCSPSRVGFFAAQGIVNLQDNGPDDGGLVVLKGSSRLMKDFFDEHGRPPVPPVGEKVSHLSLARLARLTLQLRPSLADQLPLSLQIDWHSECYSHPS